MTVPIDYGMWGWTWDQNGNRTAVRGLINPFWIAVNMLLRAMGLYGDPPPARIPPADQARRRSLNSPRSCCRR